MILLLGRFLPRRVFVLTCLALIGSSFVLSIEKAGVYSIGPIFRDGQVRREMKTLVDAALRSGSDSNEKRVLATGWYLPLILAQLGSDTDRLTKYVGLLSGTDLQQYRSAGYEIYYLPEIREYNLRIHKVDLAEKGVRAFDVPGK